MVPSLTTVMQSCKVAHLNLRGTDLVLIPVKAELAAQPHSVQTKVQSEFQQVCIAARLKGDAVLVMIAPDGRLLFLSNPRVQPLLEQLTPDFLQRNMNFEISSPRIPAYALDRPFARPSAPPPALVAPARVEAKAPQPGPSAPVAKPNGRSERSSPMQLVTLVFTDIVGSTDLKTKLGDLRARDLIRWHHEVVRATLAHTSSGEEISTAGDSFLIVFSVPSEALSFALQLQAKLRTGNGREPAQVFDRIGIHLGEVYFEEEPTPGKRRDVYGIQVDCCARLMSLGVADQILMTRVAFDNARQTLRGKEPRELGKLAWVSHGMYLVKGVSEAIEVLEVGEIGRASLKPPQDSEKGKRVGESAPRWG